MMCHRISVLFVACRSVEQSYFNRILALIRIVKRERRKKERDRRITQQESAYYALIDRTLCDAIYGHFLVIIW